MIIHSDEFEDLPTRTGGSMGMHLFRPVAAERFPALLFFSEIYQVTAPIRRLAVMLAGHGYVVGVPEVYHAQEAPGTVLPYDQSGTDRGNELKISTPLATFDKDAQVGLDYLAKHPASNGRLGAIGCALGGISRYALRSIYRFWQRPAFTPRTSRVVNWAPGARVTASRE